MFSQTKDSVISDYITKLSAIWAKNSSVTFNEILNSPTQNVSAIVPFYNLNFGGSNAAFEKNSLQKQINLQEQMIYQKDAGVSFIAAYQKNFQTPFADPEDIVVFRQKFQTGLQWDFFRSGLYENRMRLKQLKFKQKELEFQNMKAVTGLILKNNFNMIIYLLNEEKITVLQKRKVFMESFASITKQLLSLSQVSKENFIKVQQHLNDIDYQLNVYQRYNQLHENLKLLKPEKTVFPVFDIDYNKVAESFISPAAQDSSAYYNMVAASSQNYMLKELGLNANVKYNFYDVANTVVPNRSFVSVGVNLSMPIAFNYKYKKQKDVLTAQLYSESVKAKVGIDTQNVVLNSLYEFKYKQKQYGNLLQKRELFEELIRNEEVKYQFNSVEFNPLTANIILDDYWSTTVELLDLKQDMYRILNELKLNLPHIDISTILKPYTFAPALNNSEAGLAVKNFKIINAVYLWSDVFKNNSNATIINYCKLNNFNTLVISSGKNTLSRVNELLALNNNFNYELMVGNNKLLVNGGAESYFDSLTSLVSINKLSGLHLDVEPHTFADFKSNKESYFEKYIQLIKTAYAYTSKNKLKLSVSIPLNYPEEVLKEVFAKCDKVYLMAYENVKPSFIFEKMKEELVLGKEKVVLALRTNDFENKAQMDELFSKLEIKHTAYHDLDELIKMSKKNLDKSGGK